MIDLAIAANLLTADDVAVVETLMVDYFERHHENGDVESRGRLAGDLGPRVGSLGRGRLAPPDSEVLPGDACAGERDGCAPGDAHDHADRDVAEPVHPQK